MNSEYMNNILENKGYKGKLEDTINKYDTNFTNNFINFYSIMINMYKEMTEYQIESEEKEIKKVPFFQRLLPILGVSLQKLFNLNKDSTYGMYFASIMQKLIIGIPIIGNIPFVATVLGTLLGYLVDYLLYLIVKNLHLIKMPFEELAD